MWPFILFLMEKLISQKKWQQKSPNNEVALAAFKLLEIISCLDIDEFNLHKWAFVFEFYGVTIKNHPNGNTSGPYSPFLLTPMLFNKIPTDSIVSFTENFSPESTANSKRVILITENRMTTIQLELKVKEFLTYIVSLSSSNMELEKEELETLIQGDFIEFGNMRTRQQISKLKEIANQVKDGEMPIASYKMMHPTQGYLCPKNDWWWNG